MFAIGRRHLEWGSADQPPLAPAPAGLADGIAPGSLIELRLPRCAGDRLRCGGCRPNALCPHAQRDRTAVFGEWQSWDEIWPRVRTLTVS
ncbi:MAG: hypothetical protein QOD59_1031 [Mycobacterium sp.]|jgi:hypothetical protein|nr:hypothetical protein [Mycobacterium sp.]